MSVTYISEFFDRSFDGKVADDDLTRSWKIEVTSKTDTPQVILAAGIGSGLLPGLYQSHPDNIFSTARSLSIKNVSGKGYRFYTAIAKYSTKPIETSEIDKQGKPDPLDWRAKKVWSTSFRERVAEKDRDGKPILNSAGDQFLADGRVIDDPFWVISITKNVTSLPAIISTYRNTVNNATVVIGGLAFATGTLKFGGISISDVKKHNNIEYYEFGYELTHNEDTWALELLDQGFNYIKNGVRRTIEIKGQRTTEPVMLNGSGGVIALPTPANASYRTFNVLKEKNFGALPGISDIAS